MVELVPALAIVIAAWVYARGGAHRSPSGVLRAARPGAARPRTARETLLFAAALATLFVAVGPLAGGAEGSLTAHMVQHVLIVGVAGPLVALADPWATLRAGLPLRLRRGLLRARRRVRTALGRRTGAATWLAAGVAVQAVVFTAWHLPGPYDTAVTEPGVHAVEHLSLLGTSVLLWWAVLGAGRRRQPALGVLAVFVSTLPATALGVLMTLATTPWYAPYATGSAAAALTDQQVAGVVMWGFGAAASVVAGTVVFAWWLQGLERATPSRPDARPDARPASRPSPAHEVVAR